MTSGDFNLDAFVYDWWTANGLNTPEIITEMGCSKTGHAEADECIDGWGLNLPTDEWAGQEEASHMVANGYTRDQLAAAILAFWHDRPDIETGDYK